MLYDLRYALRTLRKSPGFALVAIISLALGIGANSAMFSLADALLLRPLPVPHGSELIVVQAQMRGEAVAGIAQYSGLSYPDFKDLRDRNKSFTGLTASQYSQFGFATEKGALPRMKFGEMVSGDFFSVLEVPLKLGRAFRPDEGTVPGRDAVVVLGHELWRTDFDSDPGVVGRTIFLNNVAFTVIGVAPEPFTGSNGLVRSALFVPLAMGPRLQADLRQNMLEKRDNRGMTVYGRLKPGVSVAQAAAEARVVSQQLAKAYPATNLTCSMIVDTDVQARLKQDAFDAMLVFFLLAMAGVVLLIACANVTNILLSRARARSREIAVRLAIGAGRGRLVRQLLTESLVIAALGGGLGLLVAKAGVDLFGQIKIPADIPVVIDVRLDPRVLLFTILASVASALVFGLAPALQSSHPDLVPALKSGKSDDGKRRRLLGRNTLVIAQVAGALLLLVFATQAYRGASIAISRPAGFRTSHLLMASFDTTLARYTPDQATAFFKPLLERARNLPGVKSAALTQAVPMLPGGDNSRLVPEGVKLPPGTEAISVISNTVSEDYFDTLNVPIVEGRAFQVTDRADSRPVAIVNERLARKYYPNQSPIGKRLRLKGDKDQMLEIVGVARQSRYFFLVEPAVEYLYRPLSQNPQQALTILVETAGPSSAATGPLREIVRSLDAGQPMYGVRTMEEVFDQRATKTLGILTEAIGGMGLLGLILAMVGLYGLMSYSVSLRSREIGIRMAIGAGRSGVLGMVMKQGMVLAAAGVSIGLLLCWLASKGVSAAVGVPGFNLPFVALVTAGLVAAAALGAYAPALRASRLDPNAVLRQE
ncbi:MAG TPA: ABC transporter permease [Bryobacteraceae bacterium]|jgi:predicted permease|nr:ABC transporter permease [Bryobacteraceae bacterium]